VFHGERFFAEIRFLPAFHGFSPIVYKNLAPLAQKKPSRGDGWVINTVILI
jgi:hypothetical protein